MDRHQHGRAKFWLFLGAAILIVGLPINPLTVPDFLMAREFSYTSTRLWLAPFNVLALVVGIALIRQRQPLARTLFVGRSARLLVSLILISGIMAYASLECGSLFVPLPWLDAQTKYIYRDYHMFSAAPQASANAHYTDYFSARHVPSNAPLKTAEQVIWFFGGSTMQDIIVRDDETIVHHAVRSLAEKGISAHAKNFGTVRFNSSTELVKLTDLLRRIPKSEHPEIVVFYDGYNDAWHGAAAGAGNADPFIASQFRMLIEAESAKMLTYSATRIAANYSPFFARIVLPWVQDKYFYGPIEKTKDLTLENARESANIYAANTEMIRTLCEKQFGIRCLFVLQPMSFTRASLTPTEKRRVTWISEATFRTYHECYSTMRTRMTGQPDFVDASGIFDDVDGDVFADLGHTNAKGSQRSGEFIGDELYRLIARNKGMPSSSPAPQTARAAEPAKR